jgi:DGQHR domain-containing protein
MDSLTNKYKFTAIAAHQNGGARVFTFAATSNDILNTCEISRAGRDDQGQLFGFQRSQIASHIQEIKDYLLTPGSVLPNAIVVGFLGDVSVEYLNNGVCELTISTLKGKPGFVVDGQQRLTALSQTGLKDFQLFVSCVICDNLEDMRQQFILINNTRPLPKSLIYELLPEVKALPKRLGSRSFAAELTERLNYSPDSSLHGMINLHTNPAGIIKDTSIQKVIMYSNEHGALREYPDPNSRIDFGFEMLSNFYGAVQDVFPEAWHNHTPRTSRLVHGAGMIAMGFVMETLFSRTGRMDRESFVSGISPLKEHAAWICGSWNFQEGDVLKWDQIENTPRQIQKLALHLVGLIKRQSRQVGG